MTNTTTFIGNLTDNPELKYTPNGRAVASFTIADTPRKQNPQTGEWEDGDTNFQRAEIWNSDAENLANSLTKGTRVIATGRLRARNYETKEGEKRTSIELIVDEIGPSLKYATAQVTKTSRTGGGNNGGGNGGGYAPRNNGGGAAPAAAPSNGGYSDDTPF